MQESADDPTPNADDSFCCLPLEIVELILSYADAGTVISASKTCSSWKNLVNDSKKISQVWRRTCYEEIQDDYRKDIVNTLFPKYFMAEQSVEWEQVYKAWKKWLHIETFDCYRYLFYQTEDDYSTLHVTGCWLLIAYHNVGRILAKHIDTKLEILLLNKTTHLGTVHLVCDCDPDLLDSGGKEHLLPGAAHDKLVVSLDMPADVIIDLRTGRKSYFSVLGSGENLWYCKNYRLQLHRSHQGVAVTSTNLFKPDEVVKKRLPSSEFYVKDVWDDKILLWVNKEWVIDNFKLNKFPYVDSFNGPRVKNEFSLWDYPHYVFKYCSIIIHVKADGLFVTIVGKESKFLPLKVCPVTFMRVKLTCAAFYAGMLLLGCHQGIMYGYRTKEPVDLLDMNLDEPSWVYTDMTDCINSFAVEEAAEGQVLWISTSSTIQRLTFSNPDSSSATHSLPSDTSSEPSILSLPECLESLGLS